MLRLGCAEFILSEAERLSMTGASSVRAYHAERSETSCQVHWHCYKAFNCS